jgi:ribosome-binding protein aMBF1 (putative translation factor)
MLQKTLREWIDERGIDLDSLAERCRLDRKVLEAIVAGRYTTSPRQREALAEALQVLVEQIRFGGAVPVDHMYGHGPQFGRSP